jgi:hypothetical protein
MPTVFTHASNVVRTATDAGVDENGKFQLWTSSQENNSNDNTSVRAHFKFGPLDPDFGNVIRDFEVAAVIEAKYGTEWVTIARSFTPFRDTRRATEHVIIMQPNMIVTDVGIPDIDADELGNEFSATSRSAGKMAQYWRTALYVTERGFGTPGAFVSLNFSVFGEIYNV